MSDDLYQAWIEQRRAVAPPNEVAERVMQLVMEAETQQKQVFALRLAIWIEGSRIARYVACGVAMMIGSMPFVTYFAYLTTV